MPACGRGVCFWLRKDKEVRRTTDSSAAAVLVVLLEAHPNMIRQPIAFPYATIHFQSFRSTLLDLNPSKGD